MNEVVYLNLLTLYVGVRILCSHSTPEEYVKYAHNIHSLILLADCLKHCGPLDDYNPFPFEN